MKTSNTVQVEQLVQALTTQHGYILNEKNEDGYIMENTTNLELGQHSVLFHCDFSTGEVELIVGQIKGEPNAAEKNQKIQEFINNVSLSILN